VIPVSAGSTARTGLAEFVWPKAIARQRMKLLLNLTSFSTTDQDMRKVLSLVTILHGRRYR